MKNDFKKYAYLWENPNRYVLLKLDEDRIASIIDTKYISMVLIDDDIDRLLEIRLRMAEAGAETFYNWDDFHKKYPPISSEERIMRMKYPERDDEFPTNQN